MKKRVAFLGLAAVALTGCDRRNSEIGARDEASREAPLVASPPPVPPGPHVGAIAEARQGAEPTAKAQLAPVGSERMDGDVMLYETDSGVRVVATVQHAQPGLHGFHVHETGDCSKPRSGTMGGHFAPSNHEHALPSDTHEHHLGDLGNLMVAPNGSGRLEIVVESATLRPGRSRSFLGKAVVLHQHEDGGYEKQPAGGSGAPVACGVIQLS